MNDATIEMMEAAWRPAALARQHRQPAGRSRSRRIQRDPPFFTDEERRRFLIEE